MVGSVEGCEQRVNLRRHRCLPPTNTVSAVSQDGAGDDQDDEAFSIVSVPYSSGAWVKPGCPLLTRSIELRFAKTITMPTSTPTEGCA